MEVFWRMLRSGMPLIELVFTTSTRKVILLIFKEFVFSKENVFQNF